MSVFPEHVRRIHIALIALVLCSTFCPSFLLSDAIAQKTGKPKEAGSAKHDKQIISPVADSTWLIRWNGGMCPVSEFEQAYRRMNDKEPYATTLDSLKDFLSVYADYRLKLEDAKAEGMDKDPKIQTEIKGYRTLLAGPYALEKELTEPAIRQMYDRRKYEVRVAHFLAGVRNWNNPADTLKAYKKAMRAIEMLNAGYPMSYVAMSPVNRDVLVNNNLNAPNKKFKFDSTDMETWEGSDDKPSSKMGGDLGWFTAGMTVRPFEDAAYSMKIGEISKVPVKTHFGYHIMELLGRHERVGGVHVAHILVAVPKGDNDTIALRAKADSLLRVIRAGANFAEVARESSDDKFTAIKGGDMDTINREERRTEAAFDAASYGMKDGEVSDVIRTSFGYHIIKRLGTVPVKKYEQEKEQMKQYYKRFFFDDEKAKKISQLRHDYNLSVDTANVNLFMTRIDSSRTSIDSGWAKKVSTADRAKSIYRLAGEHFTVGMLVDSLTAQPGSPLARNAIYDWMNKQIDEKSMQLMARNIGTMYPEFEQIMEDYTRGIILFELENKRVWSQVGPDSAKEYKFFTEHSAKFMWPERIDISEIFVTSDSLAKQLFKRATNGENFDSLAKKYTERAGYKEKAGHWGIMQKGENELARRAFGFVVDEVKEPFSFQGGFSIVRLNKRDPIHPKTFAEARQEVASLYQDERANELRTDWALGLRQKYNREINQPLIEHMWNTNHSVQ